MTDAARQGPHIRRIVTGHDASGKSVVWLDGLDIKVIIGECEIYSINQHDLQARPGDFGRDFLGRALPACLFQASDYVQALREHKRYMADMQPLLAKYDILLTAGFGPAPRFEDYRVTNFWRKSNAFTPSNSARTPALVMCGGLSKNGLPLGLQLIKIGRAHV